VTPPPPSPASFAPGTGRGGPRAVLWAVGFSVFIAADDLTVVSTMLRPIIGDLGMVLPDGLDDAAWVVNAYLIAFVAIMPIAGRISDVVGRRATFVMAYACFLAGTIWIPLTNSLGPFLVGRVLTALGGGAMVPVALAVVADVYPERQRGRALGVLGSIETMGWVWGPLYGAMLVRFLDWRWQFWLNVPLGLLGLAAVWHALRGHDHPREASKVGWSGAGLLTLVLVSLSLALLGGAEVQSVTGLDQLTGGGGPDLRWLYLVAAAGAIAFVAHQRRSDDPLIDRNLLRGRNVRAALVVNFVIGAALVIAMVDVPLFVNAVENDLDDAAVTAGWILSALTAAMAVASYVGGRLTERWWTGPPIVLGLVLAAGAYGLMGATWDGTSSYGVLALQLAVLGAGIGLTFAPTNAAVVDDADPDKRGTAAALVMVVRLIGLSVGLSALTAWGLSRFNALRGDIELPPLTDPGFDDALRAASAELTASAISDTFVATAVVLAVGLVIAALLQRRPNPTDVSADHSEINVSEEHAMTDESAGLDPDPMVPGLTDGGPGTAPAAPSPPAEAAVAPSSWLARHLGLVLGIGAALLLVLLALVVGLFVQLDQTRSDLATTQSDIARVEAGAALFASQVTGFQEQLTTLSPTISAGLDEAVAGLEEFATSTLEFDVAIDENVVIDTEVVIDRTISVPIDTTLPINESFDTTIEIQGPFGTAIPIDVTVPVDIDVPIDLTVDIPINETVPINAEVPVKVDVPIRVDVADTELANLTTSLAAGLDSFREVLAGLGGN
jgi:EmrB/QacA subfamily drug resistance transporter